MIIANKIKRLLCSAQVSKCHECDADPKKNHHVIPKSNYPKKKGNKTSKDKKKYKVSLYIITQIK